jgi:hypothetical protein
MTRPRRAVGWAAVLAILLALPSIAVAERFGSAGSDHTAPSSPAGNMVANQTGSAVASPTAGVRPASSSVAAASDAATTAQLTSVAPSKAPIHAVADGIVPGSVNATSINLTAEYDVIVRLNFGTRAFRVDSTMTVTNTSGTSIDRLELNTIAARLGGMAITIATVDGKAVHPTVTDQTIHFPLGGVLAAGQKTTVRIAYRATLRSTLTSSNWLFTRVNGVLDAYRWLPWISKPVAFNRPNHGDPFVTPVSPRVRVTIVSERALRFATTGEQVGGSGLTRIFEARNVRDFSFTGAADYSVQSATVGNVIIHVWGRPGFPISTVMRAAKTALSKESALLGAYPYRTYDVAQSAGGYGMESPGLTWMPPGVASGNIPYLVAHETGHQWFYGIVGNNQALEPFADEAATDFVARYALGLRRASRCSTARLDLTIYQYSSACYYEDIYIQGGNFLDDLRRRMGSTAFWAGVRDYLAANRFKLTTTKTLLNTLDAHTPLNLVPRFEPRFPKLY